MRRKITNIEHQAGAEQSWQEPTRDKEFGRAMDFHDVQPPSRMNVHDSERGKGGEGAIVKTHATQADAPLAPKRQAAYSDSVKELATWFAVASSGDHLD